MEKGKHVRGTFCTRKLKNGDVVCNVPELARMLLSWENVPKSLSDGRASEIALLAQAYLNVRSALKLKMGLVNR